MTIAYVLSKVAAETEEARGEWFIHLKMALENTVNLVKEGTVKYQTSGMVRRLSWLCCISNQAL